VVILAPNKHITDLIKELGGFVHHVTFVIFIFQISFFIPLLKQKENKFGIIIMKYNLANKIELHRSCLLTVFVFTLVIMLVIPSRIEY